MNMEIKRLMCLSITHGDWQKVERFFSNFILDEDNSRFYAPAALTSYPPERA